jgi:hypothetical protein
LGGSQAQEVERGGRTAACSNVYARIWAAGVRHGLHRPVMEALRMSKVGTLVISDDPPSPLAAWVGP